MKSVIRRNIIAIFIATLVVACFPVIGFADETMTSVQASDDSCIVEINHLNQGDPDGVLLLNSIGAQQYYKPSIKIPERPTIYPNPPRSAPAKPGEKILLTTIPKPGFTLTKMSYTTASGKTKAMVREQGSGKPGTGARYSFIMPDENVKLNVEFSINRKTIRKASNYENSTCTIINGADGTKASRYPQVGSTVTVRVRPSTENFKLVKMNYVADSTGKPIALTRVDGTNSIYTFVMPNSNVTVNSDYATLLHLDNLA